MTINRPKEKKKKKKKRKKESGMENRVKNYELDKPENKNIEKHMQFQQNERKHPLKNSF